ncbi:uncharacterized protein SAPINGB_P003726 [Magnusiomyces paraingens]|uniref:Smr domain-containing protein n=1 Tax=Magnusiomyces paraingens TaxID=2606893 RepID=A0A5E8BRP5_9ASCO|nr:uncharacterized protein SAPINGB_P003726 [Saprochaete ingens]VVT53741.1 unnamed protein product [Saprochaete ingens]
MSLSLSDVDKNVLSHVIKEMYPSIEDMVDITLNTFSNFDDAITNLKFMGADDIDHIKIMEAYKNELQKNIYIPSSSSSSSTKLNTDDIPGMDDIEDDDYIPNYDNETASDNKISTFSHLSPSVSPLSSRSSTPESTYLATNKTTTNNNSNKNSNHLSRDIRFDESREHSEDSFTSFERNSSLDSLGNLEYTTPVTVKNKNSDVLNDFKKMKISNKFENQDYQWDDNAHEADGEISNGFVTNDDSDDSIGIDDETFHQYLDFLQMSFPDVSSDIIVKTLKECDYDPGRTSDQLLNINAIENHAWGNVTEPFNNRISNESNDDSGISEEVSNIAFLVNSFPDMSKDVIEGVYQSNNQDLIRSSDELLTLQMLSNDPNLTNISTENVQQDDLDPVAFLKMSFPQTSDKQIADALESNDGDVMLASDELLSAEIIINFKEEMQLHQHLQKLAETEWEKYRREQDSLGKFQTVRSRHKKDKAKDENIDFLMDNFGLDKKAAQILYENSNGNLFNAITSIMNKNAKKQPVKHSRLLTSLDMKVQRPGSISSVPSPSFRGYKPNSAPIPKHSVKESISRPSTAIDASYINTPSSSGTTASTGSWNNMNIQDLVDEEQETRMVYMRRAAEAYRKASSNPLYRSVAGHYMNMARQHAISNNARLASQFDEVLARQTTDYSIDLHHLSVSYALDATRTKIENWWTKESSSRGAARTVHHLRIITGAGTHSVDNIPRIKNGVKKILLEGNWNFTEHRAHFDVYGQRNLKQKTNA